MQMDMRGRGTFGSLYARKCDLVSCTVNATRAEHPPDGTRETLVTLGVVVLQTNLQFDGLDEVATLLLRSLEHVLDARSHT